ncbi:hypothetical protein M0813_22124 [Anaeramoeba flamelloides]|uniref:BTB domain-containing protein n=1 Tax=Anaeramoeba flamelloides TaxID=1746091 RepID=A0ABQ8YGQ1_9EUKA|nr:hypothetical protein M0813_22124 [Anaeramoeba flamelloides]
MESQNKNEEDNNGLDSFVVGTFSKGKLQKISLPNVQQGCGGHNSDYLLTKKGELYDYTPTSRIKTKKIEIKKEIIKKIVFGYITGLILTESGTVYCMGSNNAHKTLCVKDKSNLGEGVPNKVEWFQDRDIKIRDIASGSATNYFVSTDNTFYSNGYNSDGQMGIKLQQSQPFPVKILEDVDRVFSSNHSHRSFLTTLDDKLMSFGRNQKGKCGLGYCKKSIWEPTVVPNISGFAVKDIVCTSCTALLFKNGQLWVCGVTPTNGLDQDNSSFKPLKGLENIPIRSITGSSNKGLAISEENQIYVFGVGNPKSTSVKDLPNKKNRSIRKIKSTGLDKNIRYNLYCSIRNFFILPDTHGADGVGSVTMEFLVLLEKGKFSDYELMENKKLKVHKRFVELRTNSSVKQIEDILVNYKENEIMIFLKWVYSGNIINYMIVNEICKQLGIENLYSKSFYDDLFKLYKDEESKNFNLLVKQEDFSDDNDDDDDDDNENFEEIPVHKYILYARSGLFREMFDQIDENSDSITDYSKKSIESLEIFVKYLYTNKIELTADDDPQLVVEELQDAVDYYQLSKYSNLPTIFKHLKNNF